MVTHGTLVTIMAYIWKACEDHGKMAGSWEDHGRILTKQPWFVMVLTKDIMSKIRLNHFQLLTVPSWNSLFL